MAALYAKQPLAFALRCRALATAEIKRTGQRSVENGPQILSFWLEAVHVRCTKLPPEPCLPPSRVKLSLSEVRGPAGRGNKQAAGLAPAISKLQR